MTTANTINPRKTYTCNNNVQAHIKPMQNGFIVTFTYGEKELKNKHNERITIEFRMWELSPIQMKSWNKAHKQNLLGLRAWSVDCNVHDEDECCHRWYQDYFHLSNQHQNSYLIDWRYVKEASEDTLYELIEHTLEKFIEGKHEYEIVRNYDEYYNIIYNK